MSETVPLPFGGEVSRKDLKKLVSETERDEWQKLWVPLFKLALAHRRGLREPSNHSSQLPENQKCFIDGEIKVLKDLLQFKVSIEQLRAINDQDKP